MGLLNFIQETDNRVVVFTDEDRKRLRYSLKNEDNVKTFFEKNRDKLREDNKNFLQECKKSYCSF
jgi:hypothetical protein